MHPKDLIFNSLPFLKHLLLMTVTPERNIGVSTPTDTSDGTQKQPVIKCFYISSFWLTLLFKSIAII